LVGCLVVFYETMNRGDYMLQVLLVNLNEGIVIECSTYRDAIAGLEADGFQILTIIGERDVI